LFLKAPDGCPPLDVVFPGRLSLKPRVAQVSGMNRAGPVSG